MKITYYIDDGYVGYRPHYVEIEDWEINNCLTLEEIKICIDDIVENDFRDKIMPYVKYDKYEAELKKIVERNIQENEE